MATTIRPANPTDVPQILAFIRALAAYEREPDAVQTATEADLLRDGFGPNPFYSCLIAEQDGQPAGFALYFFNYSTWLGAPGALSRGHLRSAGVSRPGDRQGAAQAGGRHRRREELPAPAMGGAGLEHARPSTSIAPWAPSFLDEWRNVRVSGEAMRGWRAPTLLAAAALPFAVSADGGPTVRFA
jgi:hypothetical protein